MHRFSFWLLICSQTTLGIICLCAGQHRPSGTRGLADVNRRGVRAGWAIMLGHGFLHPTAGLVHHVGSTNSPSPLFPYSKSAPASFGPAEDSLRNQASWPNSSSPTLITKHALPRPAFPNASMHVKHKLHNDCNIYNYILCIMYN